MPDYGFLVNNTSGEILVDANYANHSIVENGSFSGGPGLTTINFAAAYSAPPLLFVRGAGFITLYGYTKSANTYTGAKVWAQSGYTFDYYVAVASAAAAAGNCGLQVFTDTGAVGFDSNRNYMKIRDIVSFTPPTDAVTEVLVNHSSAASPYCCLNALQGTVHIGLPPPAPNQTNHYYTAMRRISETQIGIMNMLAVTTGGSIGNSYIYIPSPQQLVVGSLT